MGFRKQDDHAKEVEQLREKLLSMEQEMRRVFETKHSLHQSQKQNERLSSSVAWVFGKAAAR